MNTFYRFAVILLVCCTFISGFVRLFTPVSANAASLSVWWPTDGATISGTQPFKALVDGVSVDSYSMYWQVDGGQLNQMSSNSTDYPHKEASVDVSGWHWSSNGSYALNFVAKDQSGNTIVSKQIAIHVNVPAASIAQAPAASQAPAPVQAPITQPVTQPVVQPSPSPAASTAPVQVQVPIIAPVVQPVQPSLSPVTSVAPVTSVQTQPATSNASESVWWPTANATVTGTQPFKAVLNNVPLDSYTMYWQVDGDNLVLMSDNYTDAPHKESSVDLTNWNWHGTGPYMLNFVAKNSSGATLAQQQVPIYTGVHTSGTISAPVMTSSTPVVVAPSPSPAPITAPVTTQPVSSSIIPGDPLSGLNFYVDPNSDSAQQVSSWLTSNPAGAQEIEKISTQPVAKWLGDWNANIYSDTKNYVDSASSVGKVPIMIAYNIPQRDCGSYSAGGASSVSAYGTWISGLASGIGSRKAVVVLEPDALAMIDCLSSTDQANRYSMLNSAITTLKSNPNTVVYLDAGNSNWIGASDMASRLTKAGIAKADGFSLNVSNFYFTSDNVNYGNQVSPLVGGKHFVVDTSRNGLGSDGGNWCNPSGRALGIRTTTSTGNALADGFLWLKTPGESDGTCNGGPSAGVWWPDYALGLAQRAAY